MTVISERADALLRASLDGSTGYRVHREHGDLFMLYQDPETAEWVAEADLLNGIVIRIACESREAGDRHYRHLISERQRLGPVHIEDRVGRKVLAHRKGLEEDDDALDE